MSGAIGLIKKSYAAAVLPTKTSKINQKTGADETSAGAPERVMRVLGVPAEARLDVKSMIKS